MAWTNYGRNKSKYGNEKAIVDGIVFDSRKEARQYSELLILEKAGEIGMLQRQVKYILIPAQYEASGEVYTKGEKKGQPKKGKLIERECAYIADFQYFDYKAQEMVVLDTKGFRTPDYLIKRKLMLFNFGIRVKEV